MCKLSSFCVLILVALVVSCSGTPASSGTSVVAGAVATPSPMIADSPVATTTKAPSELDTPTTTVTSTPTAGTVLPTVVIVNFELSRYAGRPGDVVSLRGQGFVPYDPVHVEFRQSPSLSAGDAVADGSGEVFVESIRIPMLTEGQHTLVVRGASGREVSRVFSVVGFHPWVVLTAYAVHPGEGFGFNGSEFVPGEQIQVFQDGAEQPIATVSADDRGNLAQELLVRATPGLVGKHDLQFVGSTSSVRLPVTFEVLAFVPLVELTSYAGPPGTTVGFNGKGFAPGETVHVYRETDNGRQRLASLGVGDDGSFNNAGQVVVAADSATRVVTLVLEGEQSRVPVGQRFGVLDLAPWGGLSQYSGPAGTEIDLLGKGFAAGETVDIAVGTEHIASAIADGQGGLHAGPVSIPGGSQGTVSFSFRGQNSKGEATASFTVTGS